jgi:hypothetical protein
MLATSAMAGQATFSLEEDEVDLDGVLTVSGAFFAAGMSADALPPEPGSLDAEEEETESPEGWSFVPASAETVTFFLLSVR